MAGTIPGFRRRTILRQLFQLERHIEHKRLSFGVQFRAEVKQIPEVKQSEFAQIHFQREYHTGLRTQPVVAVFAQPVLHQNKPLSSVVAGIVAAPAEVAGLMPADLENRWSPLLTNPATPHDHQFSPGGTCRDCQYPANPLANKILFGVWGTELLGVTYVSSCRLERRPQNEAICHPRKALRRCGGPQGSFSRVANFEAKPGPGPETQEGRMIEDRAAS